MKTMPPTKTMTHLSCKVGLLGITFLVLFVFSAVFANDVIDFEKMLQEANRANQESGSAANNSANRAAAAPRTPAAPVKETQPVPNPGAPARMVMTRPLGTEAPSAVPIIISDGWTTVKPNDPSVVIPEFLLTPPAPAKAVVEALAPELPAVLNPSDKEEEEAEESAETAPPAELFEPDLLDRGGKPSAETGATAQPLFSDDIFEEEYTVIPAREDELGVLEPESDNSLAARGKTMDIWELDTIAEPKLRRRDESKSSDETAPQQSELSATLDALADKQLGDEPATEAASEDSDMENTKVTLNIPDFDSDDDETSWTMIDTSVIGDPFAQDKLRLMYDEVMNGLRTRNITGRYEMWKNFARGIMRDTSGINTKSELDGRSRLNWFLKLYSEPVRSTFEAEEYSRELYVGFAGGHRHLAELMPGIRDRMDVPKRETGAIRFPVCTTPVEALAEVKRALLSAATSHAKAFATLTVAELADLDKNFVETFVGKGAITGHTVPARSVGRRLVDIMDKVNTAALYDGAEALIPLTNTALLDLLAQLPDDVLPQVMINGQRFQRLATSAGDIIIGGRGRNVYDLDSPEMREVICVISRGEEDTFREGTCTMQRPVMVIIALGNKSTFVGTRPGIQGSSIMGISMLLDRSAQSTYDARDLAQGSTMGGVGILINYEGGNTYKGFRRVQGHALLGLGLLIDRGRGNALYKASLWAQGFGAPGGFGVLSNSGNGNNHYYCGGLYLDSYPEHPGYDGWGQGVGAGIRQVANGGIGVILSGTGDDVYEVDYFGHGGGYWLGVGIARDFGGNDTRHGTTLADYNGRPRVPGNGTQSKWTRFVNGWGCHYALGYLFDDGGDDLYGGQIMGTGMAWDLAYGVLADFQGSGRYTSTGNMKHGVGAQASIGILFSYGGNDIVSGRSQGTASPSHDYHPASSGGNFSFLINYGGDNLYGTERQRVAQRHSYVQRGSISGFLIDRPTESEAALALITLRQAVEQRNQEIAEYDAALAQMQEQARQQRRPVPSRLSTPRPRPISESQLLGAVPDFELNTDIRRADAAEANVR